jgi:hypothetical protein
VYRAAENCEYDDRQLQQELALSAASVTPNNEVLIRTHHPCFLDVRNVYVYEHPDNEPVWVVDEFGPLPVSALQWIRVAGKEVHIHR